MSEYDRNFSTAAAIAPSSNAICRNKASGSDCDSFSVLVSRCAYSTKPSGNTVDAMKPHRAITCRLTSARKPLWSTTRPSKSTSSLLYWLSPEEIFAKAYPAENQSTWLDGIESAFFFFKARPRALVCDNTRCLVRAHKRRSSIEWTQAFESF